MGHELRTGDHSPSRSLEAATTVAVRVLNYVMGFAASVLIARVLGPEGRGAYFVIVTVAATAMSVGHLSIEHANLFLWSRADRRQLVGGSLVMALVAGAVVAIGAAIILRSLGDTVPVTDRLLLWIALATVPGGLATLYLNGLLVNGGWLRVMNRAAFAAAVVQVGAILVLALLNVLTVAAVIAVWAITTVLPLTIQLPGLARAVGIGRPPLSLLRRLLAIGLRYHVGLVALFLVLRVDVFMLNSSRSAAEVGHYSLAVTLAEATFLVTNSVAQTAVSGQLASDDSHSYTARIMRTNLVLALVLVGSLVATGPVVVPLLFGAAFGPSVLALTALGPGVVALAAQRPLGVFAIQQDRPGLVSAITVTALAGNVLLNSVLIPRFGIVGAAVASSATYISLLALSVVWFERVTRVGMRSLIPHPADLLDPVRAVRNDLSRAA